MEKNEMEGHEMTDSEMIKMALKMFPKLTYEERLIVHALIEGMTHNQESAVSEGESVEKTE